MQSLVIGTICGYDIFQSNNKQKLYEELKIENGERTLVG